MATKQIIDQIRMGDRVSFTNRMGKSQTGKAVMYGPGGWVLNMGGAHGTPAGVKEWEITKVVRPKGSKSTLGTARLSGKRNPAGKILPGDKVTFADGAGKTRKGTAITVEKGQVVVDSGGTNVYAVPLGWVVKVERKNPGTSAYKKRYKVGAYIQFEAQNGRTKYGTVTATEPGGGVVLSTNLVSDFVPYHKIIMEVRAGKRTAVKNPVGRAKNIAGFRDAMGIFHPIRSGVRQSYSATKQRSVQRMDVSPYVEGAKPKKRKPAKKTAAKKRK